MTDLETGQDDWARGVFDRVRTGQHEPYWTPDAATAARLSDRRRVRFRAAGAFAVVAVAGLSATAFNTLGGSAFQGRETVSPAAGSSTWSGLDLTKYLEIDGAWKSGRSGADGPLSATGLTTVSTVLQRLDPSLDHVRTQSGRHRLDVGPQSPGSSNIELYTRGFWAPKGDVSSFPPPGTPFVPTTPFGYVSITAMGPQFTGRVNAADKPCGMGTLVSSYLIPQPTSWSPCVRAHQADGSDIVTAHSVNLPAGTVTVAVRLFPDGSSVRILASTVIGHQETTMTDKSATAKFVSGPPLNPAPWTDAGLAQALSGPYVKGLS